MTSTLRKTISSRLPDWNSIWLVFAVVCLVLYGWTIANITWKLNSWLTTLTAWEIFSVISYLMVINFLEACLVMAGLLGLCVILPASLMKDQFVSRALVIALCILGSMGLHLQINSGGLGRRIVFIQTLKQWWLITFLLTIALAWFLPKVRFVSRALQEFADRATVFLYILMPLTALGFIVIIFRFLFPG
jgi:hypothetical protein